MPQYGYGGLYQPQYQSFSQQGGISSKAQQSGPQPTMSAGPVGGWGAKPIIQENDPYKLSVDEQAYQSFVDRNRNQNIPGGFAQGAYSTVPVTRIQNGENRNMNLALDLYAPAQGGFAPGYNIPGSNLRSQYAADLSGAVGSIYGARRGQVGRMLSFEDLRNAYQNQILGNIASSRIGAYGGRMDLGVANEQNKNLQLAYQNLVSKMRSSGAFGQQGRVNQSTGYTGGA